MLSQAMYFLCTCNQGWLGSVQAPQLMAPAYLNLQCVSWPPYLAFWDIGKPNQSSPHA